MKTIKNALISIILIGLILIGASRLFNFELPAFGSSSSTTSIEEQSTTLKAGTFVFNDEISTDTTLSQPVIEAFIDFNSNNEDYFKIKFWQQNGKVSIFYQTKTAISEGVYQRQVYTGSTTTWLDSSYKTIEVTSDVTLNEEFYNLLMEFGHYQSNSEM